MLPGRVLIILLKSSQAVSSSARFNLGTPEFHINRLFIDNIINKYQTGQLKKIEVKSFKPGANTTPNSKQIAIYVILVELS